MPSTSGTDLHTGGWRAAGLSDPARSSPSDDELMQNLLADVWAGRWKILLCGLAVGVLAVGSTLLMTPWYQADVLLSPVSDKTINTSSLSQFGGLASLVGVTVPGAKTGEAVAILKSKAFARDFIQEKQLQHQIETEMRPTFTAVFGQPKFDIRDNVKFFDQRMRYVTEDKKSGLVTLSIRWIDSSVAAGWANELVNRLNERMRNEAILETQISIDYLQKEMLATSVVPLQQSIGKVLEDQMQKMALARANRQFAFKIIDEATPPKEKAFPRRLLFLICGLFVGCFLGGSYVVFMASSRNARDRNNTIASRGDASAG